MLRYRALGTTKFMIDSGAVNEEITFPRKAMS